MITEVQQGDGEVLNGLWRYGTLPDWLIGIADPHRVRAALARTVPEFATGQMILRGCTPPRVRLKSDGWTALYRIEVAESGQLPVRGIGLVGEYIPAGQPEPDPVVSDVPFAAPGWRCYLSELRLELGLRPPETALPVLSALTEPEEARTLLQGILREQSPALADLRIQGCEPQVVRYHPGSRATIVYHLSYARADADRGWPGLVVAKTYRGDKGRIAYEGMRSLWESPLHHGETVSIAPPLAFVPEMNLLIQGPVHEQQTLQGLLRSALMTQAPAALADLDAYMAKTAAGLAALHGCGAETGMASTWKDELDDLLSVEERVVAVVPSLEGALTPLIDRLRERDDDCPADAAVPSHGSFRPSQVLLHDGDIAFIDFDSGCQAEPALDVALFVSRVYDLGLRAAYVGEDDDSAATDEAMLRRRMEQLEGLCELFVSEYERHAPISRPRVELWDALFRLTQVLHCWTKIRPARLVTSMELIERSLRRTHATAAAA